MNNFISKHTITTRNSYQNKNTCENNPKYQLIFSQHIMSPPAISTNQIFQHSTNFLGLSVEHTLLPTRLLILIVHTKSESHLITHSETLFCTSRKTFNATSYGFIFLCFLSFYIIGFKYCILCSYPYI